jgi:hypothetical protein
VLNDSHRLIHMGDWRDSVVAKSEETGSTGLTNQVRYLKTLLSKAERVALSLDAGPANGCPLLFLPIILPLPNRHFVTGDCSGPHIMALKFDAGSAWAIASLPANGADW